MRYDWGALPVTPFLTPFELCCLPLHQNLSPLDVRSELWATIRAATNQNVEVIACGIGFRCRRASPMIHDFYNPQALHPTHALVGSDDRVFDMCFSPASTNPGFEIAAVGQDGNLRLWAGGQAEGQAGDCQSLMTQPFQPRQPTPIETGYCWNGESAGQSELLRVIWSSPRHILTGSSCGKVTVLEKGNQDSEPSLIVSKVLQVDDDQIYGLCSEDRGGVGVGVGSAIMLYDLETGTCVGRAETASNQGFVFGGQNRNPQGDCYVFDLRHTPGSNVFVASCSDGTVRLLNPRDRGPGLSIQVTKASAVSSATLLGQTLACTTTKGEVSLLDIRYTGAALETGEATSLCEWSAHGTEDSPKCAYKCCWITNSQNQNRAALASCGLDRRVNVWGFNPDESDPTSLEPVLHGFGQLAGGALCCAASAQGEWLCAGGDGGILVWPLG
eukprot:c10690_g1_i2.p1 GENE.c10690_g1_i2~~c10690_g1_i2.p1  ORF type:complete len:443 (-),score=56.46 c10690_g1_i2:89-1417(-)